MEKGKQKRSAVKAKAGLSKTGKAAAKPAKPAGEGKKSVQDVIRSPGIKKQYAKSMASCKVTFVLPKAAAPSASSVCIAGDFNNWSITQHPLKRLKNGDFTVSIDLDPGREYRFRYIIDAVRWENDWHADKYVANEFGDSENSVVIV